VGALQRFSAVVDTATTLHFVRVDLGTGRSELAHTLATQRDHPALQRAALQAAPELAAWHTFARHPWVAVRGDTVLLGDGRYSPRVEEAWCNFAVPLPGP